MLTSSSSIVVGSPPPAAFLFTTDDLSASPSTHGKPALRNLMAGLSCSRWSSSLMQSTDFMFRQQIMKSISPSKHRSSGWRTREEVPETRLV